jgi:hypothetical protein
MKKYLAAAAAATLGLGGLVLGTTAASAHTATADISCESWSASATAYDEAAYGTVIADGVVIHEGAFNGNGSYTNVPWASEADSHRLQVTIDSTEDQYDYSYDQTVTGCITEVPPTEEPPVVTPHIQDYVGNCDAAFVLDNLGSTVDVTYTINGIDFLVSAGTAVHTDADGTRIEPSTTNTYVITTDTGASWEFQGGDCETIPPTEEPPVEPEEPVVYPPNGNVFLQCDSFLVVADNLPAGSIARVYVNAVLFDEKAAVGGSYTLRGSFPEDYRVVHLIVTNEAGETIVDIIQNNQDCNFPTPPAEVCEGDEVQAEDGSCVPPTFYEPEIGTPISSEAPVAPAPSASAPQALQEQDELPQTGNELALGGGLLAFGLIVAGVIARRFANR